MDVRLARRPATQVAHPLNMIPELPPYVTTARSRLAPRAAAIDAFFIHLRLLIEFLPGPGIGAAQHGHLVPQHEQLRILGRRRTTKQDQPAAEADEDQIEQTDGHGRTSCPTADPGPSLQLTGQADFWHPTGSGRPAPKPCQRPQNAAGAAA
jgi:hypothetical protein